MTLDFLWGCIVGAFVMWLCADRRRPATNAALIHPLIDGRALIGMVPGERLVIGTTTEVYWESDDDGPDDEFEEPTDPAVPPAKSKPIPSPSYN